MSLLEKQTNVPFKLQTEQDGCPAGSARGGVGAGVVTAGSRGGLVNGWCRCCPSWKQGTSAGWPWCVASAGERSSEVSWPED